MVKILEKALTPTLRYLPAIASRLKRKALVVALRGVAGGHRKVQANTSKTEDRCGGITLHVISLC